MTEGLVRIVLADDTEDVRLLLRIALSRDGRFEVVGEARNGREAVDAIAEHHPDVILLDLAMPVMDGMQAIPEIRVKSPETRIVVLSGFERSGIEREALELGAHAYVVKGTPLDQMIEQMGSVVPALRTVGTTQPPVRGPADREVQDVLSTLGHELSSPVAVIEGFASLIAREANTMPPEEVAEYADAIARGGKQLQGLISAFYDAHHLGTGEFYVDRESVAIDDLVRETIHDLAGTVDPHPLAVDGSAALTLHVDPVRAREVISALVDNAAKFSPADAPIDVTLRSDDGVVAMSVSDRCAGIKEEDTPKLFGKFSKLRRGGPGMGLGLYISRGIAQAHGGDLTYEPREGGGCVFTLRLPI